jgi:CRP-like cAMP-binding protein
MLAQSTHTLPTGRKKTVPTTKSQKLPPVARTNSEGKPVANKILLALPDEEFQAIRPHLQFVDLTRHLILHEPHRALKFAHFPNAGVISLVIEMKDGKSVEAGLLGKDGAAGMSAVLGLSRSPLLEVVQVGGNGFRVKVDTLRRLLRSTPQFQLILGHYAAGLAIQISQTAACNRIHKIEERLARWLLMAQDRVASEIVPITHDFLAMMLGTDRSSVTVASGVLQRKKIIRYTRGAVKIVNRKKLEQFACECYAVVKHYDTEPVASLPFHG